MFAKQPTKKLLEKLILISIIAIACMFIAAPVSAEAFKQVAEAAWFADVPWMVLASAVVGLFSAIAAITPNTTDNGIADFLLKLINVLGANVGKAKNKESE